MNSKSYLRNFGLIVAIFALACLPALAKNPHPFHTMASVMTPNGKQIPAGVYEVSWQSHSPTATVTFMKGNQVVATVDGHWADHGSIIEQDAILYQQNPEGMATLMEIRFAGRSQTLIIDK
jgi:hypothetical protein